MRKLALIAVFAVLVAGCESKNPVGPGKVTISQSTSTTTSTTTSTIPPKTTASFVFSPATPAALQLVSFNGFGSTAAPGRTIVSYDWDFGDGKKKNGLTTSHDFFPEGLYIVTLTVTDSAGETASVSQPIGAGVPLPPSTTTSIPTNTAVRYVNTQASPEIPADLTLFFQLITTLQSAPSSAVGRLAAFAGLGDFGTLATAKYSVRGVYTTLNGQTGTIQGELVGTLTPAPNGTFTGSLTAILPGCSASREFSGPLTTASLQWTGGSMLSNTCGTNPLAFSTLNLLKSDSQAPIPLPTTTTAPTTTTSVLCNFSLTPVSVTLEAFAPNEAAFQTSTVAIGAGAAGCGWSMQTSTPWITLVSPTVGSGPATVSFQVANNTTFDGQRRVGSVVIAGITFLVTQNPPSDIVTTIPTTTTTTTIVTTTIPTTTTTTTIPTTTTTTTTIPIILAR